MHARRSKEREEKGKEENGKKETETEEKRKKEKEKKNMKGQGGSIGRQGGEEEGEEVEEKGTTWRTLSNSRQLRRA